jgi:hypothetical protein
MPPPIFNAQANGSNFRDKNSKPKDERLEINPKLVKNVPLRDQKKIEKEKFLNPSYEPFHHCGIPSESEDHQ